MQKDAIKTILIVISIMFVAGLILQSVGYIDWELLRWFTYIELYNGG